MCTKGLDLEDVLLTEDEERVPAPVLGLVMDLRDRKTPQMPAEPQRNTGCLQTPCSLFAVPLMVTAGRQWTGVQAQVAPLLPPITPNSHPTAQSLSLTTGWQPPCTHC